MLRWEEMAPRSKLDRGPFLGESMNERDWERLRLRMVQRHIAARGVRSPLVLAAMGKVRREVFVPAPLRDFAYDDAPLQIGGGQTISQPYMVALMVEALDLVGGERVLEVGTGSGYAAAVLAEIAGEVATIERREDLAWAARERLELEGCSNVRVLHGDGSLGWPEGGPFDGIVVAAGGPDVPRELVGQLAVGGRLVMPVGGESGNQELKRIVRLSEHESRAEDLALVRFVPLIGAQGWHEP